MGSPAIYVRFMRFALDNCSVIDYLYEFTGPDTLRKDAYFYGVAWLIGFSQAKNIKKTAIDFLHRTLFYYNLRQLGDRNKRHQRLVHFHKLTSWLVLPVIQG